MVEETPEHIPVEHTPFLSMSDATARERRRPTVLLTTEGTYPFILGGVSTWCDILVNGLTGIDWRVLPLTAGGLRRSPLFELPSNVAVTNHLDLWSETVHPWNPFRRRRSDHIDLPGVLARGLLGWTADPAELIEALLWCRREPSRIRLVFRSRVGWESFLTGLETVLDQPVDGVGAAPDLDVLQATELYQSLYWVARTASVDTSSTAPDALLVSAAGWAAIPAVVHRAKHGTPMILTEHGVYVREAYLNAVRTGLTSGSRWSSTRLAHGLARLAYSQADLIAPVAEANATWERALGVDPAKIHTIYNGVLVPPRIVAAPGRKRVVSVCRVDPLKDIKTMLRAAASVVAQERDVEFLHYGPVPEGGGKYKEECDALHRELELGERFRFMGGTDEPFDVVRAADVAFFSSISEGFPVSVLEAMACGRPVVATAVGGVPEALAGCGFTAPPGAHEALAAGLLRLLRDEALARDLGERGYARVARKFGKAACLEAYHRVLSDATGCLIDAPALPADDATDLGLAPVDGDHAPQRPPDGRPE